MYSKQSFLITVIAVVSAFFIGYAINQPHVEEQGVQLNEDSAEQKPLYWVAPMDPNFRRDQPGLSPMGMELVPVYQDSATLENQHPGTVLLTPEVTNNISVKTKPVMVKPWHNSFTSYAYFTLDEERTAHIHNRVSGWIEHLYVKAQGEAIGKGQKLYRLYSPEIAHAQEELVLALKDRDPRLTLAAKAKLRALAVPESAIEQISEQQAVLSDITFYAPLSGYVENLNIRPGFFIKPETRMMSIASLDTIWLIAEVFESQLHKVSIGDSVTVELESVPNGALSESRFNAQVDFIYPKLDAVSKFARVRIRIDNPNHSYQPNMRAKVTFAQATDSDRLIIDKSAVIRNGTMDRVVVKVGDGQYRSRIVTVGGYNDHEALILQGLVGDEEVVTSAQFLIDSQSQIGQDLVRFGDKNAALVWVTGEVLNWMPAMNHLVVHHDAIPQWQQPAMTMDFQLAKHLDQTKLTKIFSQNNELDQATAIRFQFSEIDGNFVISALELATEARHEVKH